MAEKTTEIATRSAQSVADAARTAEIIANGEIGSSGAATAAQAEVHMAMTSARSVRRDEDDAYQRIIRSCRRSKFAENVEYRFPRGGKQVSGPSVYLLREIAKAWGNMQYGFRVVQDTEELRTIRGYAWDLESNTRVELEDSFKKLIQRKVGGDTKWVSPDERDLRELTNRRGAILVRECIRGLIPQDYVDGALEQAAQTLRQDITKDPDEARKKIIAGFDQLNIKPAALKQYLGGPLEQASPAQLADLRAIFESVRDGNSKWSDYLKTEESATAPAKTGTLDPSKLTKTDEPKAKKKARKKAEVEFINADELEAINNLQGVATKAGLDMTEVNEYLKAEFGSPVLKRIPRDKFEQVVDWLTDQANALLEGDESEVEPEPEEAVVLMSDKQLARVREAMGNLGITEDALRRHLAAKYGSGDLERLQATQETEVLSWLTSKR